MKDDVNQRRNAERAKIPTRYRCAACDKPLAVHTTADMLKCRQDLPRDASGNTVRYPERP